MRRSKRPAAPRLGSARPTGWLSSVLQQSVRGLAGRLLEFYPPVRDSDFVGGRSSYSSLQEDLPYALHGLVPLAAVTRDDKLSTLVEEAVERVLGTRSSDGWLGPDEWPDVEDGDGQRAGALSASIWARIPMLQALVQYAEGGGKKDCAAFSAILAFVFALRRRLNDGRCRLVAWSSARWPDLISTLNWLMENPLGPRPDRVCVSSVDPDRERHIRSLAWTVRVQGFDWSRWFSRGTLPSEAVTKANFSLYSHGVNNAVGIKWGAVWSAIFGSPDAARASPAAWRLLRSRHGVASGAFAADEHLAGKEPYRGTELCVVVESMRSLAEAYAAAPWDVALIDALERLAFNALPAAMGDDHWTHQYLTQSNAVFAGIERAVVSDTDSATDWGGPPISRVFGNVGADATAYGLSPNFPCCAVNFAQGWPKLLSQGAWLLDSSHTVPIVLSSSFVPSQLVLPPPVGGQLELRTNYPFHSEIILTYMPTDLQSPLVLLVRIPGWADLTRSHVVGPSGERWPLLVNDAVHWLDGTAEMRPEVVRLQIQQTNSTWEVHFGASWQFSELSSRGSTLVRGPLVFAIPIPHSRSVLPPELDNHPYGPGPLAPPSVRDEELITNDPTSWAKALIINGSSGLEESFELIAHTEAATEAASKTGAVFTSDGDRLSPSSVAGCPLSARGTAVSWPAWYNAANAQHGAAVISAVPPPPTDSPIFAKRALPSAFDPAAVHDVILRPFGCTRLRMAQVPVVLVDTTFVQRLQDMVRMP